LLSALINIIAYLIDYPDDNIIDNNGVMHLSKSEWKYLKEINLCRNLLI